MKGRIVCAALCLAVVVSSCRTTGEGALTGAQIGTILGSAIGGLSGGPRGSDAGIIVGMAAGAAVGAAIGSENEKEAKARYSSYRAERAQRYSSTRSDDSGYDPTGSGNDVIVFDESGDSSSSSVVEAISEAPLEIRNITVSGGDGDDGLSAGEEYKVAFLIINSGEETITNVTPIVEEASGTKYVGISQAVLVESIAPKTGIRYTATLQGTSKLRDGEIEIKIGVTVDGAEVIAQTQYLTIQTAK